jgi:hypothetical protein
MAQQNYKKYKDTVVLHMAACDGHEQRLDNKDCQLILMSGVQAQRDRVRNIFASDNNLTELPCTSKDFPSIEWLILSTNCST